MPKKKPAKRKSTAEYEQLSIKINRFETEVSAGINHFAHEPQYAWRLDDQDSVFQFSSHITIFGTVISAGTRKGHSFQLRIYGDERPSSQLDLTLKDIQKRNKYEAPEYRTYRGKQIPVYNPPNGLGLIEKVRGSPSWTSWVFVKPSFASDTLKVFSLDQQLYLSIQERKEKRSRWIRSLSIQSTNPEI